jgi:hypothetical protein
MNLVALPAFTDNCFPTLCDGTDAIAVDSGGLAPVIGASASKRLSLPGILVTHRGHRGAIRRRAAPDPT